MIVELDLPEDISEALTQFRGDVPGYVRETLAKDGYRSGVLSRAQVARLLGFSSSMEVDVFMKSAGIPLNYSVEDLDSDLRGQREMGILP